MHYYSRHLGDYAKDTGHLSLVEHGVYTVLLDWCYSSERALPADDMEVFRICRALTRLEQAAVRRVLSEFFPSRSNPRADREIALYRSLLEQSSLGGRLSAARKAAAKLAQVNPPTNPPTNPPCLSVGSPLPTQVPSPPPTRAQPTSKPLTVNHDPSSTAQGGLADGGGGGGGGDGVFPPEDGAVFAYGAAFPGEPATGATGPIERDFIRRWLVRMHGRDKFPPAWKRLLVAAWREHCTGTGSTFPDMGRPDGGQKKNAGRTPAQARFEMSRELEDIEARMFEARSLNQPLLPEDMARGRELREELKGGVE